MVPLLLLSHLAAAAPAGDGPAVPPEEGAGISTPPALAEPPAEGAGIGTPPALAEPPARTARAENADDLARIAREAGTRGDVLEEAAACEALVQEAPTHRDAARCARRLATLAPRRDDDGSLTTFADLEAWRRDPARDPAALRRLRTREGVAPALRAELALVEASLAQRALDNVRRLEATSAAWAERAHLPEPLLLRATLEQAAALAAVGRFEEAAAVEALRPDGVSAAWGSPVMRARLASRRGALRAMAGAIVALWAVAAVPAAWRPAAVPGRPWGLVPLGVCIGLAALIAEGWEHDAGLPLLPLLAGGAAIHVIATRALAGRAGTLGVGLRALTAAATLAVGLLALDATGAWAWVGL